MLLFVSIQCTISHPNLTTGKLHYLTLFFTVITSVERYKF